MGYAASVLRGEDIVLPADHHEEIWKNLYKVQEKLGSHISWCSPLPEYEATGAPTAQRIVEVMNDYGFETAKIDADGDIVIDGWGGDKLGSCWEGMWEHIIAPFTKNNLTWVMQGEDSVIWVEAVRDNKQVKTEVTTTVFIAGEEPFKVDLW
jgi:sulfite reductase beta subunit-like hemoprotein